LNWVTAFTERKQLLKQD